MIRSITERKGRDMRYEEKSRLDIIDWLHCLFLIVFLIKNNSNKNNNNKVFCIVIFKVYTFIFCLYLFNKSIYVHHNYQHKLYFNHFVKVHSKNLIQSPKFFIKNERPTVTHCKNTDSKLGNFY
ncbi:hypothetical protein EIN_479960 [Entamoeba invadens IP1]|uniref:Uncharacterized protein n=1 Tax=Entamoeba invadens IP1 TaxID=370355 RepID=L7FPF0_ENTIV|nr:hypothetical protein EIN_479960 [Entamoeba invadens IP1]ELP91147.1 hypothetical protein EIN_479960 [Entamoeba invadens IP1]|eukprot:XP_004257918.1 hypothetical protein EIN_479960 [Entamoeba invadens IP1]